MEGLKAKTFNSAKWSLLEKAINIGFEFTVGILLARLLIPSDFGTVAIITVIISLSLIFVNSGFTQSLIRDPDINNNDYSTIFLFNLFVGIIFYFIIFFSSNHIALFYDDQELILYLKILGLTILISSLTFVQRVMYTREMNFKMLSKISIVSSFSSGIIALTLAFSGFGIWSLIAKTLLREIFQTILFWAIGRWKPSFIFNQTILKKHFRYGSNFLLSAIIGQFYNNILALTIGKIFNLQTLGYYNRAQLFSNTISENIGGVMTGVSFPALAKVQHNKEKFIGGVRILMKQVFFVVGILTIIVFFSAKTFIPLILGDQWVEAGVYLKYLCIIGFFGVLNSVLVNSISVTGKSKVYLYFQIWALSLNIISLTIGYFYGIENMLLILIGFYSLLYVIISKIFQYYYGYSLLNQIADFRIVIFMFLGLILIGSTFTFFSQSLLNAIISIVIQVVFVLVYSTLLKIEEFLIIKKMLFKV